MVDEVFRQVDRQRCDRSRSLCPVPRMAMCSKSTVLNAIAWLELYGFIDKLRRIVRTTGLLGQRVRQTSNAYVLSFPQVCHDRRRPMKIKRNGVIVEVSDSYRSWSNRCSWIRG